MTLDEAKQLFNFKWDYELADILDITPAAVSGWDPTCIPEKREFQILKKAALLKMPTHSQNVSLNASESNI